MKSISGQPNEEMYELLLDGQHNICGVYPVSKGVLDASLAHPREVYKAALRANAAGVILVHNHPSGDPTPSPEDRAVSVQLKDAGRILGIPFLDHVIIGDGRYVSLAEEGLLDCDLDPL
jgi:DNA repair protein RadC